MQRFFLSLAPLASAFVLPLAAHANTIDDFVFTSGGNTHRRWSAKDSNRWRMRSESKS